MTSQIEPPPGERCPGTQNSRDKSGTRKHLKTRGCPGVPAVPAVSSCAHESVGSGSRPEEGPAFTQSVSLSYFSQDSQDNGTRASGKGFPCPGTVPASGDSRDNDPHPAPTARPRDPSTAHGDPGRPHTHTTPPTGTDGASARREGPCAGGTRVCEVCGGADPDEGCQGCGGVGEVSL